MTESPVIVNCAIRVCRPVMSVSQSFNLVTYNHDANDPTLRHKIYCVVVGVALLRGKECDKSQRRILI